MNRQTEIAQVLSWQVLLSFCMMISALMIIVMSRRRQMGAGSRRMRRIAEALLLGGGLLLFYAGLHIFSFAVMGLFLCMGNLISILPAKTTAGLVTEPEMCQRAFLTCLYECIVIFLGIIILTLL